MMCLKPQSYGSRIQNRIIHDICIDKNINASGNGDNVSINGKSLCIKTSILDSDNSKLNLVQIRRDKNLGMIVFSANCKNLNNITYCFYYLAVDQVISETQKSSSAHSSDVLVKDFAFKELKMSLNDKDILSWEKYRKTIDELRFVFL